MFYKKLFFFLFVNLCFGYNFLHAQSYKDIVQFGGYYSDKVHHAVLDQSDNMIVGGMFSYSTWADDSLKAITTSNEKDAFIMKFSKEGDFIWGKSLGGKAEDKVLRLTTDQQDNIYAAGTFRSELSIGSDNHTGLSAFDNGILVKYDKDGNYLWSNAFVSTKLTSVRKIAADKSGNIYAEIFTISDSIKIGDLHFYGPGNNKYFSVLVKLNQSGKVVYAKRIRGANNNNAALNSFVIAENEDLFTVIGTGNNDLQIGDSTLSNNIQGFLIARFNSNGNLLSYKFQPSPSSYGSGINEIKCTKNYEFYLVGYFTDSITINGFTHRTTALHDQDFIIFKSDKDGNIGWVKTFGSTQPETLDGLDIDNDKNIIVTGRFPNRLIIDNDTLISPGTDGFVVKYDANGKLLKAVSTKSTIAFAEVFPMAVLASKNGSLWIAGDFNHRTYFDDSLLAIRSLNDGFLWRVKDLEATPTSILATDKTFSNISVYPNPAQDVIYITSISPLTELIQAELFSMDGKKILTQQLQISRQQDVSLSISSLKAGMYILKMQNKTGQMQNKIIVKQS